jgi:hypothetical protein
MSLANALNGLKEAQHKPAKAEKTVRVRKSPTPIAAAPVREITMRRPIGKSANPDYEKLTLYARKDLRRRAERKFEDDGGKDFSDLLEAFLTKYLAD